MSEQLYCEWPRPQLPDGRVTIARRAVKPWQPAAIFKLLPRNVVIYDGPSLLTGDPILVIASGQTSNRKIGAMVQLWILTRDISPLEAVRVGADRAICGDCRLRGDGAGQQRTCYVEWWRAPENIHQARGKAVRMGPELFADQVRGKQLRIGAYGDPVAVPLDVWRPLLEAAAGWTAYTHQWRTCDPAFAEFCMASVDSLDEQRQAAALGWRTFRIRLNEDAYTRPEEVVCPASDEGGHRAVCASCSLCRGQARQAKHVVIVAHGQRAKWFIPLQPVVTATAPRLVRR